MNPNDLALLLVASLLLAATYLVTLMTPLLFHP